MPQSANDQVEPRGVGRASAPAGFQCLSRQTIKWNVVEDEIDVYEIVSFNASVGKRSSGTTDEFRSHLEFMLVSMPQSANDQVELAHQGSEPD